MTEEHEVVAAFDAIEQKWNEIESEGQENLVGVDDFCAVYGTLRGSLEIVLKAVEKIPFLGRKIGAVIRLLMKIADSLCNLPSA